MTHTAPPSASQILVVGAGLAGLACARELQRAGVDVHLLEASDAVGGRIRTDEVDGFLLDRGFQVLLTAYGEVQRQIDLERLDVKAFGSGSLVWNGKGLQRLSDPWRDPRSAMASLKADVGSLGDKLKVASLRKRLLAGSPEDAFQGPDRSTLEELEAEGFSQEFIDTFFRPFLGGVFLERELETSARLFRYYFRCFAAGEVVVPSGGMQRLPEQLAEELDGRIHLNNRVASLEPGRVTLEGGRSFTADQVVLATNAPEAARLLGEEPPGYKAAMTAYWAADRAPVDAPLLVLDGEGTGPVNHLAVMSLVAPGYAPEGRHLVSASGVGEVAEDVEAFRTRAIPQLRRWFGDQVEEWTHLRSYRIPHALPRHLPGSLDRELPARPPGLMVAGDYTEFGAIQGALLSGRRTAETILARG